MAEFFNFRLTAARSVLVVTIAALVTTPVIAATTAAITSAVPAATATTAAPVAALVAGKSDPRAEIVKKIPGTKVDDVRLSPISGMYELARGADIIYVTSDARYAIAGDLYDMNGDANLSERRRRDVRLQMMAAVPESQMVVFAPKDPKYTVTVFTDVDCTYCRKLHSEIAKYNELGIRVRYMFYPRSGPDTESWAKAEAVWCSADRNDALTRAKRGEQIKAAKCANTPVARDFEIGQEIGLRGTPGILLANGELMPGYMSPAMLVKKLQPLGR